MVTTSMRISRFGSEALLVHHPDLRSSVLAERIRRLEHPDVIDVIVGATSVTVRVGGPAVVDAVAETVGALATDDAGHPASTGHRDHLEIPVVFDGPDLPAIAAGCDLSIGEVVAVVTGTRLEAAFSGFTAGFAYLDGLPEILHVARRATPRPRVAPGSVAIAGGYAGVYTIESPGGWNIIGHTTLDLWDIDRRPPALIVPGMTVTMREVGR